MDAASPTSTYKPFIPKVDDGVPIKSRQTYDMTSSLYETKSYNARFGIDNAYDYLDEMLSLSRRETGWIFENFILPSRDLFGFCDNFKAASFLHNVATDDEGSCVQSITNVENAVDTYLNPTWYFADRKYLKGSSTGSGTGDFAENRVKIYDRSDTGEIKVATS